MTDEQSNPADGPVLHLHSPYYVREEVGGVVLHVGFATHAELMAYMVSIGRGPTADAPATVERCGHLGIAGSSMGFDSVICYLPAGHDGPHQSKEEVR